jgi:hypothetical protein
MRRGPDGDWLDPKVRYLLVTWAGLWARMSGLCLGSSREMERWAEQPASATRADREEI